MINVMKKQFLKISFKMSERKSFSESTEKHQPSTKDDTICVKYKNLVKIHNRRQQNLKERHKLDYRFF